MTIPATGKSGGGRKIIKSALNVTFLFDSLIQDANNIFGNAHTPKDNKVVVSFPIEKQPDKECADIVITCEELKDKLIDSSAASNTVKTFDPEADIIYRIDTKTGLVRSPRQAPSAKANYYRARDAIEIGYCIAIKNITDSTFDVAEYNSSNPAPKTHRYEHPIKADVCFIVTTGGQKPLGVGKSTSVGNTLKRESLQASSRVNPIARLGNDYILGKNNSRSIIPPFLHDEFSQSLLVRELQFENLVNGAMSATEDDQLTGDHLGVVSKRDYDTILNNWINRIDLESARRLLEISTAGGTSQSDICSSSTGWRPPSPPEPPPPQRFESKKYPGQFYTTDPVTKVPHWCR